MPLWNMTDTQTPLPDSSNPALPKRRVNDAAPTTPPNNAGGAIDDPEILFGELRAGRRSIESLAPFIPLNVIFTWHAQRRISEQEFAALMAGLEIHQVDIHDVAQHRPGEPDPAQQRSNAVSAAFKNRMSNFDQVSERETITEEDMKSVFLAATPLVDGVGFALSFVKSEEGKPAPAATPPALTVLCRAYIASQSMPSTIKCEAVFSAPGMEHELYCRIVVPLPIHKGGRRRLLVSVQDNETRQPVKLPAEVAEVFHEKYLSGLQLMRKSSAPASGIGAMVFSAFGKMFKK